MLCMPTVDFRLTVLAHHNDRSCIGCLEGKDQIQQYERIGIPVPDKCQSIKNNPNAKHDALNDDEVPGANNFGDPISNQCTTRQGVLYRDTGGPFSAKFPQP